MSVSLRLLNRRVALYCTLALSLFAGACGGGGGGGGGGTSTSATSAPASTSTASTLSGSTNVSIAAARNLPAKPVWEVYYGQASQVDLARLASSFNVIVIDADPSGTTPNFTADQIATLKSHGAKVLSYLNVGACETWRSYWQTVPAGFVSCSANQAAQLGRYSGFSEYWMNVGNADYQNLIVNYVAPRLAATGVDGFMLDNFEIVGHAANAAQGPCDSTCKQGGLDLVAQLRNAFPNAPILLNAAPTSAISGASGGVSFPMLVDGVFFEQVFLPSTDSSLLQALQTWKSTEVALPRSAFFTGTLDYVNSCSDTTSAQNGWTASVNAGLSPSVSIQALNQVCWWSFLPAPT